MALKEGAQASWFRLAVSIVLDWRFILSAVLLIVVILLLK